MMFVVSRLGQRARSFVPHGIFCLGLSLSLILPGFSSTYEPSRLTPPKPQREFRAAWVATVGNIDWPSKKDLTSQQQKAELLAIMDRAAELKLNALVFQVRPACDALYASQIEPWSEFLTGTMGRAPEPYYDPLSFAVDEAHKRGLELHAWFNPYRAGHPSAKSPASANHISKTRPQLVRKYGKQLWLDPGEKEVQDYSLSVILDVVKRYDIDGVHVDDYFYPYKETNSSGAELEFPDDASWQKYGLKSHMARDDWRRENVNKLIQRVYTSVKATKPFVKFGVSPFGIWRPGNPPSIKGFDSYANLYADSKKWLNQGWVDYLAPQLYWSIDSKEQSFPVLLKWWAQENPKHRNIYPGLDTTKTHSREDTQDRGGERRGRGWPNEEILNQIQLTRKTPGVEGQIHWNMKSLMRNAELCASLERGLYSDPALMPPSTWLPKGKLSKPTLTISSKDPGLEAKWSSTNGAPWLWLVQTRKQGIWNTQVLPASKGGMSWRNTEPDTVAVTAVDRNGNLGAAVVYARKEK
jgi:uncharacterized lipoprotein YddW (UPF0748 family)